MSYASRLMPSQALSESISRSYLQNCEILFSLEHMRRLHTEGGEQRGSPMDIQISPLTPKCYGNKRQREQYKLPLTKEWWDIIFGVASQLLVRDLENLHSKRVK